MHRMFALALVGGLMVAASPMAASADSWGHGPGFHGGIVFAPPVVRAGVVVGAPVPFVRRHVYVAPAPVYGPAYVAPAYVAPPAIVVAPPPIPVPRFEVVAPYPGLYGSVWVPGYWTWRGGPHGYHWVAGAWMRPPFRGAHWVAGSWSSVRGGHRWVGGHWAHR